MTELRLKRVEPGKYDVMETGAPDGPRRVGWAQRVHTDEGNKFGWVFCAWPANYKRGWVCSLHSVCPEMLKLLTGARQ